jgi:hypothetical protein
MPVKKILLTIFFINILTLTNCAQKKTDIKFYDMNYFEIDSLLTEISKSTMSITDKIKFYSDRFIGMPYNLTCSGDGPYALYETEPLVNFRETNCMVYCEHVLALSISDSWDNFFNNLQQIRYKNGIIGMRTRNHYTMGDWITENDWLLDDVTEKVGGENAVALTRTISHEKFFRGKGITDMRYVLPDRKLTKHYVPFIKLNQIKENILNGDILSLIFANKDDIFSAHMLIAIRKDDGLYIRESSMSRMTTYDSKFSDWLSKYENSKKYLGLAFMRVKDDLNKPGAIILPWEISKLKK